MENAVKYMGREADQVVETPFGVVALWGPAPKPPPEKKEIHISLPLGTIIIRDFPIGHSHEAIADFLREAADSVIAVKHHMRPMP